MKLVIVFSQKCMKFLQFILPASGKIKFIADLAIWNHTRPEVEILSEVFITALSQ